MPELTQLEKIKLLLGITSNTKDSLLNELISETDDFVKDYTNNDSVTESIVNQIVVFRFNKLGTEGLNSESYSGLSFSYKDELPSPLLKQLNKFRKVIFK